MKHPGSLGLLVPAAGLGQRMGKKDLPKALIAFCDSTLLQMSIKNFVEFSDELAFVIRSEHEELFRKHTQHLEYKRPKFITQITANGTAEAVRLGLENMQSPWVLLVWGDHIGASRLDLQLLFNEVDNESDFLLPLVERANPYVYFELENSERNLDFFETKVGAPRIHFGFSDCGVFLFKKDVVLKFLKNRVSPITQPGDIKEINFLSLFSTMKSVGIKFKTLKFQDQLLTIGVNSPAELTEAQRMFCDGNTDVP